MSGTVAAATRDTALLGLVVALVAGLLGLALAWLVARTDVPARRALGAWLALPYAVPPYLLAMAWAVLGNPTVGPLRHLLPGTGIYGFWGMAWVLATVAFAFPFLELRAGFGRLDPALEEAARLAGATPLVAFRDVSLPLLLPALANGMCLAFLFTVAAFGVPALLGLPVRRLVLTTLIYSELRLGGAAGLRSGLALAGLLLALAVGALLLSAWLSRLAARRTGAGAAVGAAGRHAVRLGGLRWPAALFAWGFLAVAVALPWATLGLAALAPVTGEWAPAGWTLANLRRVAALPDFAEALRNSLLLASGVASAVVALGFLLAFAAARRGSRAARWTVAALGVPFAMPGTVLALLLVVAATAASRAGLGVGPLALLGLAYGLKYAAVAAGALVHAFAQVHPSLEEAARVAGARTATLLRTLWLPLLKASLGAAWLLAALPMATELTMSVLLTGPGAATLGTLLFELQEYADQGAAAGLAWLLLTAALLAGGVAAVRPRSRGAA